MTGRLLTRDQAAARLGINPEYVRKLMARRGVPEERGYPETAVDDIARQRAVRVPHSEITRLTEEQQ
jgi:hypothetical protein